MTPLLPYILHLADNSLILGQRNAGWCGHGPVLEQDIAITNISLDLIGQARNLYQYAADLYNGYTSEEKKNADALMPSVWKTFNRELNEDDLAFLRDERQYLNLLLTELPKGDWAFTVLRQFLFSAYQFPLFERLTKGADETLAGIAEKSVKETAYHLRWSSEWVIRLGDGTEESRRRIESALAELSMFTGEMFLPAAYEQQQANINLDLAAIRQEWNQKWKKCFWKQRCPYHGRRPAERMESTRNTWATCWRKCNTCKGLFPTQPGNNNKRIKNTIETSPRIGRGGKDPGHPGRREGPRSARAVHPGPGHRKGDLG
jgi:ring-1,2-phenylacetyl-CoA epoxidase subunit PaaC